MSYIVKFADRIAICGTWSDVEDLDGQILDIEIDDRDAEELEVATNLITGLEFVQAVNTPLCCDPSSETYWSM